MTDLWELGHLDIDCLHRMDYAYKRRHPPTKLDAMVSASNVAHTQEA